MTVSRNYGPLTLTAIDSHPPSSPSQTIYRRHAQTHYARPALVSPDRHRIRNHPPVSHHITDNIPDCDRRSLSESKGTSLLCFGNPAPSTYTDALATPSFTSIAMMVEDPIERVRIEAMNSIDPIACIHPLRS